MNGTDTRTRVQIDLPLPLDVAAGLMELIGTRWPGAAATTNGEESKLTIVIPRNDRDALDESDDSVGAAARSELFLEQLNDGSLGVSGPEWIGRFFSELLGNILDEADAPNYLEILMANPQGESYSVIVGRPGTPSVHTLRRQAEQRVAELEAEKAAGLN